MPSKPQTLLILLLAAGGVYAAMMIDRTRTVPRLPPGVAQRITPGETGAPGPVPAKGAEAGEPNPAPAGADTTNPPAVPPESSSEGEIRIRRIELQRLESEVTTKIEDPGDASLVVIQIGADGSLVWSGIDAGSYAAIETQMKACAKQDHFRLIVAPDRATPWKYVYWVLELARKTGIRNVALGGSPTTDRSGTLLAALKSGIMAGDADPGLAEGLEELPLVITVGEGGAVTYKVNGEPASGPQEIFEKSGKVNSEFAGMYGKDYMANAATTPWVVRADGDTPAGKVLHAIGAMRNTSIYSVRVVGDYGPVPGLKEK